MAHGLYRLTEFEWPTIQPLSPNKPRGVKRARSASQPTDTPVQKPTHQDIIHVVGLNGGAKGDRTPDLGIANAALSQLSYRPFFKKVYNTKAAPKILSSQRACMWRRGALHLT